MDEEKIKRSIIATLIKLSIIDNNLTEKEFQFIKDISRRINLPLSQQDGIISQYDRLSLKVPKEEKERMNILYCLLFLMKMDGEVSFQEHILIRKIVFKLGFRSQMADNMIQLIKENEKSSVPQNALLDNIKKYLNQISGYSKTPLEPV